MVASSVATRRVPVSCAIFGAFACMPYAASSVSFTGATPPASTAPAPNAHTAADRSSASFMPVPDTFATAVRIHSSGDTFLPSGTTRVSSSSRRISRGVCSTRWSLMAASCPARTLVTSGASVVIPGSSTRPPISHSTARSNSSRRESRVCAAREATNVRTSASASANSRYPSRPRISRACSCWVGSRSG